MVTAVFQLLVTAALAHVIPSAVIFRTAQCKKVAVADQVWVAHSRAQWQWRVRLAHDLTARLDSTPPLTAVSQDVVRERWRGQKQPEIAALDLARHTSAGIAVYGRLDPSASRNDTVLVRMIVIDAGTGRVLSVMNAPWPRQRLPDLASALARHVRQNYR